MTKMVSLKKWIERQTNSYNKIILNNDNNLNDKIDLNVKNNLNDKIDFSDKIISIMQNFFEWQKLVSFNK